METIRRRRIVDNDARERVYDRQRLQIYQMRKSCLDEEVKLGTIDLRGWESLNPSEKDYRMW